MYEELLRMISKYRDVIIPALEMGKIPLDENIVQGFIQLVNMIYQNIYYDGNQNKQELLERISLYYSDGDGSAVVGAMYGFLQSAAVILELQKIANDKSLNSYRVQCKMAHLANCQRNDIWFQKNDYDGEKPFQGRGVIYSAITGNYDSIAEPQIIDERFDYLFFTNNPKLKSDVWKVIYIEDSELDNVRLARKIKILGYQFLQEYDYSIWIDGKIKIIGDVQRYIAQYAKQLPILCFPHYENNCVYEEEKKCEELAKDNVDVMRRQMERYRQEGYPANYGMIDSCILVRELNNLKLNQVMDFWWEEIKNESYRDQLSFNYAFWKNDFAYDTSPEMCYKNDFFMKKEHL